LKHLFNYLKAHPYLLFVFRFVIFYVVGRILFWGYVGLLYPSGGYYWPFLSHIDLIQGMRTALVYPTSWIMNISGTETIPFKMGVLFRSCLGGITIEFPCLGIQVMIAYAALILAYPAPKRYIYLLGGLLLIYLLNIGRMVGIMQLMLHHSIDEISIAHDLFNGIAYAVILFLFYMYTRRGPILGPN